MITATFQFPGHAAEQRNIETTPHIGDAIDGPGDGQIWRVEGVFRNGITGVAEITCRPENTPNIVGDAIPCPLTS